MTGRADPYRLEPAGVRRAFERAAGSYDEAAGLQAEVRERLLERLDLVRLRPDRVLDAGCGTGLAVRPLLRRFHGARLVALDLAEGMLRQVRTHRPWLRKVDAVCADAAALPLPDASLDLVFSSLMLQWCNNPDAVFAEFSRVLRPRGLLSFATFGPDTLRELREAWGAADAFVHVNRFPDMHDLGDALLRAGLAEPVMDVDRIVTHHADMRALMSRLKALGAHNVAAGRRRGLTGPRRLRAAREAYERHRGTEGLPATWEVVYGHAWGAAASGRRAEAGEVGIPVGGIGRRRG